MNVASFYRFLDIPDPAAFRDRLVARCREHELLGTVLVAAEGVNGTLAGDGAEIRELLVWIADALSLVEPIDARWTEASDAPFRRMRVRLKKEIVTLGRPDVLPHEGTGTYVRPEDWNALIADPGVRLIDTRNRYEIEVGTFPGAVDPGTDSFRQFEAFAEALASQDRSRPVAMFCTGGIRCEKASALMLELGFETVYHLQGGILSYLDRVPADESRWDGECFVFDTRVAVDRDLAEGGYVQCHACRRPLSSEDLESPNYREGVSCPKCIVTLDDERKGRLKERVRQVKLADARGEKHIGPRGD